jgi:E3 ubiquitin-protein ligase DOA10
MEAKQCRFCLDEGETPDNPLIAPCPCTGSVRYVHHGCLKRWATADPATNAQICSICQNPFTIFILEVLPTRSNTTIFLDHGALVGSVLIYLSPVYHVRAIHLGFQTIYLLGIANVFYVRDLRRYTHHQLTRSLPVITCIYLTLLYRLMQHNDIACCFFINIILFLAWLDHIRILELMNL